MATSLRSSYVVVGAGIHGLSTAYHLAKELRTRGLGSGGDVVVLDKRAPGAGASGIACGVVRNNYFQPALRWQIDTHTTHLNSIRRRKVVGLCFLLFLVGCRPWFFSL